MLGRDPAEDVTFDLDGSETKVFGRRKRGTGRSRYGHLAYSSYPVTWAHRGRTLTSELKAGNQARIKATESLRMLRRAKRLLPTGPGQITGRFDSGFYAVELMIGARNEEIRFTMSATRTSPMWSKLAAIDEQAWVDAIDTRGAQVAELPFTPEGWTHEPLRLTVRRVPVTAEETEATSPRARRRKTIPPEQLQMVLGGELDSTYAYSFIVSEHPSRTEDHLRARTLPPPARADRGTPQGHQARARAAPPAVRQAGRQPPMARLLPAGAHLIRVHLRHQPGGDRLRARHR